MSIVTRFAPSPTGYLHIGGARTALFNYLYARHMGGTMLLRIEDTDKARSTPEATAAIFSSLKWLGIDHDGEPVMQSSRMARHVEVAEELVRRGAAFYDPNNINEEGRRAIRIRGIKGLQTIDDLVQGTVRWPQDIDDFVILRSDGTPTYMLAVVVDDHDMGVTHVIRGDDHLNNAFRQNSIYQAMGWPIPVYAHIPLIYNQQGRKLSKRDGAAAVEDYRDELGIPANAMINYLARLGWGHGDDEIFSKAQAIEWFDIKDVGRNPARIDPKRLSSIAGQYIRASDDAALAATILPKLLLAGHDVDQKVLVKSMASLKERSSDLNKLAEGTHFLWNKRPLQLSELLSDPDKDILHEVNQGLEAIGWLDDQMATVMHDVSESNELKLGKVVAPLRMALTGQRNSPPIYDVMKLLGRNETLARIKDAL